MINCVVFIVKRRYSLRLKCLNNVTNGSNVKQREVSDTEMAGGAPLVQRVLMWRQKKASGKGLVFNAYNGGAIWTGSSSLL